MGNNVLRVYGLIGESHAVIMALVREKDYVLSDKRKSSFQSDFNETYKDNLISIHELPNLDIMEVEDKNFENMKELILKYNEGNFSIVLNQKSFN